ncbi:MAG: hypothetical protein J6K85_00410 [Clostridia bacterium]|nr:hypothetical protein [Clostridia bacterium]
MNKRAKPTVALIFGGRGYEKEVSVRGAINLFSLIPSEKYEKIPISIAADGRFLMPEADATPAEMASGEAQTRECYPALRDGRGGFAFDGGFLPVDAAFPLLHGDYGEDGVVQGALECARIAYVGCDVIGSAAARDKMLLKAIAGSLSIPTARGILCARGEENRAVRESEAAFGYPVFVKPTRLGSSVGAGKAENRRELRLALAKALSLGDRAMIEEYIDIEKELEIAYFAPIGRKILTSPGEIKANGFYDYEKKYGEIRNESGTSRTLSSTVESISLPPRGRCRTNERRKEHAHECSTHCLNAQTHSPSPDSVGSSLPERASTAITVTEFASVAPEVEALAKDYAARLARFLSLRDLSRIDFFLSGDGRLYFNEINTMPGFTEASLYMRLVARCGISPEMLVCALIDGAMARGG